MFQKFLSLGVSRHRNMQSCTDFVLVVLTVAVRPSKMILSYNGGGRHLYMVPEMNWLSFNTLSFGVILLEDFGN